WGRRREAAQRRWSYEHPFRRASPFLAHMIPYHYLYEYFCQAPLVGPGGGDSGVATSRHVSKILRRAACHCAQHREMRRVSRGDRNHRAAFRVEEEDRVSGLGDDT